MEFIYDELIKLQRNQLITLHLYIATFLVPFLFLMSLSGVLELLDIKGSTQKTLIYSTTKDAINFKSRSIVQDVKNILNKAGIKTDFSRIKIKKTRLNTLPNYSTHYVLKITETHLNVYEYKPSVVTKLMSLHKGNGPAIYKYYQKFSVFGLFFVLITGLWIGLASSKLRSKTLTIFISGLVFYLVISY